MLVPLDGSNLSPGVPILGEIIVNMVCLTLSVLVWILLGRSRDILHRQ
jgi:hypothetical protein